ncbi:MAG TPA: PCRF domain-containing protein [Candidatus Pacearchaeota archaeon]|nr:PCRF domain-containing protein [Candidatus Pacearchaeota archaeon]HPR80282.1 PCRF domain-containing protein [Candidatus Pacearchaeota archaeon]
MSEENQKYNAVIMEIRAGVGGEEAALFASDLARMYTRYAQTKGWKVNVLDESKTEIGGIKDMTLEISGDDVYSKFKNEAGVHRVQRIPSTEKQGRIHTSTATIAVLAKPTATQINIKPQDIRSEYYKASGAGGQYVNKRMSAIRIIHIPTGEIVTCQTERSLQQNKESALSVLAARLLAKQKEDLDKQMGGARKAQIGTAMREEKMRTYNFPQDRVTDHRIGKNFHDIESIMSGKIDKMIDKVAEELK